VWLFRFRTPAKPEAFTGPFLVDRNHPLAAGLTLTGVAWGTERSALTGAPVVMLSDSPILTDKIVGNGDHVIEMSLQLAKSNLQSNASWPALFWNLLDWRERSLIGPQQRNVRLGGDIAVRTYGGRVDITTPEGAIRTIAPTEGLALTVADEPGVWGASFDKRREAIAVNALEGSESDTRERRSGSWGTTSSSAVRETSSDISWLAILLAVAALSWHLSLMGRSA
jgi:hypothetical protein